MTISEIPQKVDYVAEVSDAHKGNLMEFLRKAFIDGDSSVLLVHPDTANGNKSSEKDTGAKTNDGKAKVCCSGAIHPATGIGKVKFFLVVQFSLGIPD